MGVVLVAASPVDASLHDLLERQQLVFRMTQVARWLSRDEVRAHLAAKRWQVPHRGVYVAHNAELSAEQKRWVALLCGPRGSALGGPTAAELGGLVGLARPETHLVIPQGARKPLLDDVVVHWSSRLDEADVHPSLEPCRTRMARSSVDSASWEQHERMSRAFILAPVQQRLVRPVDLAAALERRGPCRRHALILESIADAEGGVASVPEKDFDSICRSRGLPEPTRQTIVQRVDGRYYLDVDWRPYGVACEVFGIQHLDVSQWDDDLDRMTEISASGRRLLMFTSYSVRHRRRHVGDRLVQALLTGGWRG